MIQKIKHSIIFILFIFLANNTYTQSFEFIKNDKRYIWGEGTGTTLVEADKAALGMLINQISVNVESSFTMEKFEEGYKYSERVNSIIHTYSNATLTNTRRIVISDEPNAKIFRYIKTEEIGRIFENRKNKIIEFTKSGQKALDNLQIADALRYFYWAQTLLRSHPDASTITQISNDGDISPLIITLPSQIKEILSGIDIKISKTGDLGYGTEHILYITYKNQPVSNFTYSYWDGSNWSNLVSAKNGLAIAEQYNNKGIDELKIKAEYIFQNETTIDMEMHDVMDNIKQVSYKESYYVVPIQIEEKKNEQPDSRIENNISVETYVKNADIKNSTSEIKSQNNNNPNGTLNYKSAAETMQKIENAITSKNYTSIQTYFTDEGWQSFSKLIQYGKAKIIDNDKYDFLTIDNKTYCRAIPICFSFPNNDRKFVEETIFTLDENSKICNIQFSLNQDALQCINEKEDWDSKTKSTIINFLENYKTAYALKRLDYIENIFNDDALIIVGNVLKRDVNPENRYKDNKIIQYNRLSKQEYINRLRHTFASNEFINLRFTENNIRRGGKNGNVYGIQIKQDYFSSNYGDSGYLFLLVDLNDTDNPKIAIRTWQENKNPDGTIYDINDF